MVVDVGAAASVSSKRERRADQVVGGGTVSARGGVDRLEACEGSRAAIDEADGESVDDE